jgi:transcriptional regulator with XRE-family HTH domain
MIEHQALIDWLYNELDRRRVSQSQASKDAGLAPNAFNQVLNGTQPGLRVCIAMAQYFSRPLTEILYMAGHITKEEAEGRNQFADRFTPLFDKLTPEQKESITALLQSIVGEY